MRTREAIILGGTGQVGRAVAETLVTAGWRVTVAHRGSCPVPLELLERGVNSIILDRETPRALARAVGSGVDALIDVIAYGPDHARQLLDVQHGVAAFVVISSSSVYRDDSGRTLDEAAVAAGFPELPDPISETQQTVAPGPATYSTRKMAMERTLLDRASIPVTILRPCAIYGRGSSHPREWWFVKRILDRRPMIPIAFRGESRFHTSAATNIAALIRVALEAPGSRILNIADPSAISVGEIGATIASHMHYSGRFIRLDGDTFPARVGQTPWSVPRPFVLDNAAATALGYVPVTTYAQGIGAVCDELAAGANAQDWRARFPVIASYPSNPFDYDSEDAVLTSGESCERNPAAYAK